MLIAKIIGSVVSTIKVKKIKNTKLKIAKAINPYGRKEDEYFLVEDAIGVGQGENVLISDCGDAVSKIVGRNKVPIRSSVIAKIDNINIVIND